MDSTHQYNDCVRVRRKALEKKIVIGISDPLARLGLFNGFVFARNWSL